MKEHPKPEGGKCYSADITLTSDQYLHHFHCNYCNSSWTIPTGPTAEFVDGILVRATDAGIERSQKQLDQMNENIRWSVEYLSQFVDKSQQLRLY